MLEEVAFFGALLSLVRDLDEDSGRAIFRAGAELSASYGDTTAQEGRASPSTTRMIRQVATEEGIDIDVVVYPDVLMDRDFIARTASADYTDRVRVGGAKLTIDGSPQGFTACRDRPCYRPPSHLRAGYRGDTAASDDQVFDGIDWAFANGIQILTHSNGEGASDILIAAKETATEAYGTGDRRPVLIHGQFLREDQVDSFNRLGVFPSLFPMHTFYWGDWHREHTVGPAAADNISPTGWVRQREMMFSSHHDAPVAFPDSMRILDATVTRRSRSGDIIGPDHRVDVTTALKAMTVWPAYQAFRAGPERLHRAGQAGRSRHPVGGSHRRGSRNAGPAHRRRDDQGGRDDLRGDHRRDAAALLPRPRRPRPLRRDAATRRRDDGGAGRRARAAPLRAACGGGSAQRRLRGRHLRRGAHGRGRGLNAPVAASRPLG